MLVGLHAVPFIFLSNWETGVSEMHDRARDWTERGRRPRGKWRSVSSFVPILYAAVPLAHPSLNYCRREKKGTAVSVSVCLMPVRSYYIAGEYDHLPEVAFYMIGPIEEAVAKAERLAEEANWAGFIFCVNVWGLVKLLECWLFFTIRRA